MSSINRPCERCGNLRWLLLERRLDLIAAAVAILSAGVVLKILLGGSAGQWAFLGAATLACMLLGALIRIRCVRCEPTWRMKAWKLAGRD